MAKTTKIRPNLYNVIIVLQVFDHEPNKYWTHLNFDLMVALDEKSGATKFVTIHPERERISVPNVMAIHPIVLIFH